MGHRQFVAQVSQPAGSSTSQSAGRPPFVASKRKRCSRNSTQRYSAAKPQAKERDRSPVAAGERQKTHRKIRTSPRGRSAAGEGSPALRKNLRRTRRFSEIARQSGQDAKVGLPKVEEGTTNGHTPASAAPLVWFFSLRLRTFAVLSPNFVAACEDSPAGQLPVGAIVAQVSQPAVSPISKSAWRGKAQGWRVGKPAIQQTWKSALLWLRLRRAVSLRLKILPHGVV